MERLEKSTRPGRAAAINFAKEATIFPRQSTKQPDSVKCKLPPPLYRGQEKGEAFAELCFIFNLTLARTSSYFNHFHIRGCRSNSQYISNIGAAREEKRWLEEKFHITGLRVSWPCKRDHPISVKSWHDIYIYMHTYISPDKFISIEPMRLRWSREILDVSRPSGETVGSPLLVLLGNLELS